MPQVKFRATRMIECPYCNHRQGVDCDRPASHYFVETCIYCFAPFVVQFEVEVVIAVKARSIEDGLEESDAGIKSREERAA